MQHHPADTDKLIADVYAVTLDPARYDDLIASWDRRVSDVATKALKNEDQAPVERLFGDVEKHLLQSQLIFERLGRGPDAAAPVGIAARPMPSLLLDRFGRVIAVNDLTVERFGALDRLRLRDLPFADGTEKAVREGLEAILAMGATVPDADHIVSMGILLERDGEKRCLVALLPFQQTGDDGAVAELRVVEIGWSSFLERWLTATFELSEAELTVVEGLVAGKTPDVLAQQKGRSLATIRTQLKSVLRKTSVGSQANLMRLVASINSLEPPAAPEPLKGDCADGAENSRGTIDLGGARQLAFEEMGPASGDPVLFLHGMLDGVDLTTHAKRLLHRYRLRLIAPWRPGFAESPPDARPGCPKKRFAEDLARLLDHFDIETCAAIGHMSGALYATTAGGVLPGRIAHVVNVSGGVPIRSIRQFAMMSPRQRVIAYTARFTPKLLPPILRAGVALLDQRGEKAFMDALYPAESADARLLERQEVFRIIAEGYRRTVRQGHHAFEVDSRCVVADWSQDARACGCPITLLHGVHDGVVVIDSVRDYAKHHNRIELLEHPDAGQLLIYQDPDFVFSRVRRALDAGYESGISAGLHQMG